MIDGWIISLDFFTFRGPSRALTIRNGSHRRPSSHACSQGLRWPQAIDTRTPRLLVPFAIFLRNVSFFSTRRPITVCVDPTLNPMKV